jgi:perosamine synthetase
MTDYHVPMSSPSLGEAERAAVLAVLDTRHLSIGPRLEAFETALAAAVGARFAVGVSSGTAGLHLAVIAAGVQAGDAVITTPFSFISSANCILYQGGLPVFVDVEAETGNLDAALVEAAAADLTCGGSAARRWLPPLWRQNGQRAGELRAMLPVHAFGQPADMGPLLATARAHGLAVIEDACEALGSAYRQRPAGMLGDCGVFAFYPNKQITTGEGGMLVTDNPAWADLFRSLRNQGRDVFDAWLSHTRLGYNYRLDELSAALGLVQVGRLEEFIERRRQVAGWYQERLADLEEIETPAVAATTSRMSWFVYVLRVRPPLERDALLQRLAEVGVPSRPYFTPIHLQPFYRQRFGYRRGDFPVTEHLGDVSLALPFSSVMTEGQVARVCQALRAAVLCGVRTW